MTILLRPATEADAYALWLWANDPDTRAGSGDRKVIAWESHVTWLRARLASADAVLLIGQDPAGRPVGSIRFDTHDAWRHARLSYVVAPEARGAGCGRSLLRAGLDAFTRDRPAARVEAEVWPENARSLHLFRTMGWSERITDRGTVLFTTQSGEQA